MSEKNERQNTHASLWYGGTVAPSSKVQPSLAGT